MRRDYLEMLMAACVVLLACACGEAGLAGIDAGPAAGTPDSGEAADLDGDSASDGFDVDGARSGLDVRDVDASHADSSDVLADVLARVEDAGKSTDVTGKDVLDASVVGACEKSPMNPCKKDATLLSMGTCSQQGAACLAFGEQQTRCYHVCYVSGQNGLITCCTHGETCAKITIPVMERQNKVGICVPK